MTAAAGKSPRGPLWVITKPCGCPEGVMEGREAETAAAAMSEIYYTPKLLWQAAKRGMSAELISFERYTAEFYEKMFPSWTCPHEGEK